MTPAEATPADFTSWELGQVRDALAAEAREHPAAPAVGVLRAACVRHLVWNNYFRALILEKSTGLDTDFPVAQAVPALTALLDRIEAGEPVDDEEVPF